MTTGERIKQARIAAGLKQKELAEKLGVSYTLVSQYERNIRNPKFETLKRIAGALNISAYDLLDQEKARATSTIDSIMEMEHILLDAFSNLERIRVQFADMEPKELNDNTRYGYTFSNSVEFLWHFLKMFLESMPITPGVVLEFDSTVMLNETGLEKLYSEYCGMFIEDSGEFITEIGDYSLSLSEDELPF